MKITARTPKQLEDLKNLVPQWQQLADNCATHNCFYEPHFFLPALEFLAGEEEELKLLFLHDDDGTLIGFFPFSILREIRGWPVRVASLWKHKHCFFCTPLVAEGREKECLNTIFEWFVAEDAARLFCFPLCAQESALYRALEELNREKRFGSFSFHFDRAWYTNNHSGEMREYLRSTHSTKRLGDLRRRRKRLGELGHLSAHFTPEPLSIDEWIEQFLELEASGWKGRNNSALKNNQQEACFARKVLKEAYRQGKLMTSTLILNKQMVAAETSFLCNSGGFSFKIAYDERFARYSPGILLAEDYLARLISSPEIKWVDSCAAPDNTVVARFFRERRELSNIYVATRRFPERYVLNNILPFLRRSRKVMRRWKNSAAC